VSRLQLAFMGTPDFALPALEALVEAGHALDVVYTRAPRPAGRGQLPQRSPVQIYAERMGIPVRTPSILRDPREQAFLASLGLDAAVVVAYGLILPKPILEAPRLGCFNIHPSLLPRWRGAAPIQRAILAGDKVSGVTIMQMDEGLDTGAVLVQEKVPIGPATDSGALHDTLARLGAKLMLAGLDGVEAGTLEVVPQSQDGVSYAAKIDKAEQRLDWTRAPDELQRQVRAFSPTPGAWCELQGERIRVLAAESIASKKKAAPGTVLDERLSVACVKGGLRLLRVQRAGGKPMEADAVLRGRPVPAGTILV
jgi:methionyl-tRNA formyltransferase